MTYEFQWSLHKQISILFSFIFSLISGNIIFAQGPVTFNYTGAAQTWTVPSCITAISITAKGAQGGGGSPPNQGGLGATVVSTLTVTPGQVLQINVGGEGIGITGGWNGGGNGLAVTLAGQFASCGGGGASDVRVAPYALANRVIVAAGGGGENGGDNTNLVAGGDGGCANGSDGLGSVFTGTGGEGGTQTAGGAGGPPWNGGGNWGQAGSLGQGGNGVAGVNCEAHGGGGGGGLYGGGSGGSDGCCNGANGGGAGGGGSSLVPAGGSCTAGNNSGDGQVIISVVGMGLTTTISSTPPGCFGGTGSATVTITSGTPVYTYLWLTNPVQTGPTISNIPVGTYSCLVADGLGCTQTATFTMTQPTVLTGSVTATANVSCFGLSDGSATAAGSGGTNPMSYLWSSIPAQASATASNLHMGNYIVTISDANGCTTTQSAAITQPTALSSSSASAPTDCGVSVGTATVTPSGGTIPYTYLWLMNPAQATPSVTGLAGGNYTVLITDANECTKPQNVVVGDGIKPVAQFYFSSDIITTLDPYVLFYDVSVGNPISWSWNFGDPGSGSDNFSSLEIPSHKYKDPGSYCVKLIITAPYGVCKDSLIKCLEVQTPYTFYVPNSFTPNSDAMNEFFSAYGTYIKEFDMMIFDRWGEKIWSCHTMGEPQLAPNCAWDGKIKRNGDIIQEGEYVWNIFLTDMENKEHRYTGHVSVIK